MYEDVASRWASDEADVAAALMGALVHELRTPLNAISGYVAMMLDGPLDHDARLAAVAIQDASRRLARLADTLDLIAIPADAPEEPILLLPILTARARLMLGEERVVVEGCGLSALGPMVRGGRCVAESLAGMALAASDARVNGMVRIVCDTAEGQRLDLVVPHGPRGIVREDLRWPRVLCARIAHAGGLSLHALEDGRLRFEAVSEPAVTKSAQNGGLRAVRIDLTPANPYVP